MLSTDAYAFLNIRDPICAWATYRGTIVTPPNEPGFVSVWSAALMRAENHLVRVSNEFLIEQFRPSNRVSRLRGMFCFLDIASAEKATNWANSLWSHFRPEFLAELSLVKSESSRDMLDSNWITHALRSEDGLIVDPSWINKYWAGEPYPEKEPIWEVIVEGRMMVLGTTLRERAYDLIKRAFPDSLGILEVARLAAWVGSDLGNIAAFLMREQEDIALHYMLDMRDANDPTFLERLDAAKRQGHPTNWADLGPHLEVGSFGNLPDLRPHEFRRPILQMPYLQRIPSVS